MYWVLHSMPLTLLPLILVLVFSCGADPVYWSQFASRSFTLKVHTGTSSRLKTFILTPKLIQYLFSITSPAYTCSLLNIFKFCSLSYFLRNSCIFLEPSDKFTVSSFLLNVKQALIQTLNLWITTSSQLFSLYDQVSSNSRQILQEPIFQISDEIHEDPSLLLILQNMRCPVYIES